MRECLKNTSISENRDGWQIGAAAGSREFYNGNWALRAAAAKLGIYGNSEAEAVYPFARSDANGIVLDGSKHTYQMTFAPGQLPPVNAFWSITMYDGHTQLLIDNPINRYLVNSPMLADMKKNPDGSLTLFIQHDSPGKDKESNWLPAPDGPMFVVMRLYWPKTIPNWAPRLRLWAQRKRVTQRVLFPHGMAASTSQSPALTQPKAMPTHLPRKSPRSPSRPPIWSSTKTNWPPAKWS